MGRPALTSAGLEAPAGLEIELQDVPAQDPRETLRRGCALVSDKVGLVRTFFKALHRAQDPVSFTLGISPAELGRFSEIAGFGKAGGGGECMEAALASAIGESIERYCMFVYDRRRMVLGSYLELAEHAVAPEELRLYSREQIARTQQPLAGRGLAYFDESTRVRWVWGWSLTQRRPRLVPADRVYLDYRGADDEAKVAWNDTGGLAAGVSLEAAILSGLYEVIERDAIAISWLQEKVRRRIRVDHAELLDEIAGRFHTGRPEVDLAFYDLTLDIPIPSVFAVLRRPSELGPVLCVATAARLAPEAALRKCLSELGQSLPYIRFLHHELRGWEPRPGHDDLTTFDHHCMLYVKKPELVAPALAFCDAVEEEVAVSRMEDSATGSLKGDILRCLDLLERAGREVIVVDVTSPDIADIGFHVVRVLIPGLVPLHGNHRWPYLGVDRLHELPRRLGWAETEGRALNPRPHPFP